MTLQDDERRVEEPRSTVDERPQNRPSTFHRRPGELGAVEMVRWTWRQLTSMRTALVLLLLLALAAVPGSVIPQEGVDALKTSNWKLAHPHLTPFYERLSLFSVYNSPWFSAVYLLLMVSLVGCILPRLLVYAKAVRRPPPPAPRNLLRLPVSVAYRSDEAPARVVEQARAILASKGYRLRAPDSDSDPGSDSGRDGEVAAERGYLREAGNLVFHMAVLVVLVGFATGGLLGFQGGVIVVKDQTFADTATSYNDYNPGSLFTAGDLDPFQLKVDDFAVNWASGEGRDFSAPLTYTTAPGAAPQQYDLRVNHPLSIGGTDVFLIGHGYAPEITVRDGNGTVVSQGPVVFLPQDGSFESFGAVKATGAQPTALGLEAVFYPTAQKAPGGGYVSAFGQTLAPLLSFQVYTGNLGLGDGGSQSVYSLDKTNATPLLGADGKLERFDLRPGQSATLPGGDGTVTFDGIQPWVRLQISRSPGQLVALGGVVLALIGLLGSLFIRPRRVWVRARAAGGVTMVEVAALDRSTAGGVGTVLVDVVRSLRGDESDDPDESDDDYLRSISDPSSRQGK